jgi:hypothetical protein
MTYLHAICIIGASAPQWREQLEGVSTKVNSSMLPVGFVAAALLIDTLASVRVELPAGSAAVALHWPLSHMRELKFWLKGLA